MITSLLFSTTIAMLLDASLMHSLISNYYDKNIMLLCYTLGTVCCCSTLNLLALSLMSWSTSIISTIEFPDAVQLCWYKIRNGRLRSSYSVHSVRLTLTKHSATLTQEIISQIYFCVDTLKIGSILNNRHVTGTRLL